MKKVFQNGTVLNFQSLGEYRQIIEKLVADDAVIVKSDGTFSDVNGITAGNGTAKKLLINGTSASYPERMPASVALSSTSICQFYRDDRNTTGRPAAKIATVGSDQKSLNYPGTASVVYVSANENATDLKVVKISSTKVVFIYKNSSRLRFRAATISGTTITLGTEYDDPAGYGHGSGANTGDYVQSLYEPTGGYLITLFYRNATGDGHYLLATISGTNMTFGSPGTWQGGSSQFGMAHNDAGKVCVCYRSNGNSCQAMIINSISNVNSLSKGNNQTIQSQDGRHPAVSWDSVFNKWVCVFRDDTNNRLKAVAITDNNGDPSFGNLSVLSGTNGFNMDSVYTGRKHVYVSYDYDANNNYRIYIGYVTTNNLGTITVGESKIQLSNASQTVLGSNSVNLHITSHTDGAIHTSWTETSPSNSKASWGVVRHYGATDLTEENFIGFANAAYSNGQTATIKVVGNTTTQSGLTPGQKYFVQSDGTISLTADDPSVEAGIALSSTKLLIKG